MLLQKSSQKIIDTLTLEITELKNNTISPKSIEDNNDKQVDNKIIKPPNIIKD